MRHELCLGCASLDDAVLAGLAEAAQSCPMCGVAFQERLATRLLVREADNAQARFELSDDVVAHPVEREYAKTAINRPARRKTTTINAHELLEYARVKGELARAVAMEMGESSTFALGFMSGSYGLLSLARRTTGADAAERFWLGRGLAHNDQASGEDPMVPTQELREHLSVVASAGATRLLVVDELIGGGSLRKILAEIAFWYAATTDAVPSVLVLGVHEGTADSAEDGRVKIIRPPRELDTWPFRLDTKVFSAPRLFEKDKPGRRNRGVSRVERTGTYTVVRENPGPIHVVCPNLLMGGVDGGGATCGSHDGLLASFIDNILHPNPKRKKVWPEIIERGDCTECKVLLHRARSVYHKEYRLFVQ